MKKIVMMAVAAFMATMSANAQFKKGTWSLQPFLGGGISTITNVNDLSIGNAKTLDKKASAASLIGGEAEYQFAKKIQCSSRYQLHLTGRCMG